MTSILRLLHRNQRLSNQLIWRMNQSSFYSSFSLTDNHRHPIVRISDCKMKLWIGDDDYSVPWLWTNCPSSILPNSGQRKRYPSMYSGEFISKCDIIHPSSVPSIIRNIPINSIHPISGVYSSNTQENEDQLFIRIEWNDASTPVSYFCVNWLNRYRYSDGNDSEVTPRHCINSSSHLHSFAYDDIMNEREDSDLILQLLHSIFQYGVVMIKSVPVSEKTSVDDEEKSNLLSSLVEKVCGSESISHSMLYGNTFHVKALPQNKANNIAYTSLALCPHQDLSYYESMPGLQWLHCEEYSDIIDGGESTLIDAMAAAYVFREISPEHFRSLVTIPATFVKQRGEVDMIYQRPHITLKAGQDLNDMSREICAVNWSPPFEGPLLVPHDLIPKYFEAYSAFSHLLDKSKKASYLGGSYSFDNLELNSQNYADLFTWQRRLRPGEILVFNNRRMLHGRKSFSSAKSSDIFPKRHFIGCYTNIDETLSRYKVLLRKNQRYSTSKQLNSGNGSKWI